MYRLAKNAPQKRVEDNASMIFHHQECVLDYLLLTRRGLISSSR